MKNLIKKHDGIKDVLKEFMPVIMMFLILIGVVVNIYINIVDSEDVFLSTQFDEKIVNVFEQKNSVYLTTKANRYKIEHSRNYDYDPPALSDFLIKNDRVIKLKCSDTIFVERNSNKYHFLIGSTLYNHKEKSKEFIQEYNSEREIIKEKNDCN